MNDTLYSLGLLNTSIGFVTAGLIGILFGFFLEQAGFGSSRKLTAIFYFRDMAVLKVMFTAVVVTLVGYQYLVALGWLKPSGIYVLETYWGAQAIGGLIFGVGFVMGGWCPGTAFVGAASAKLDAFVFLGGVGLGSIFFNELYALVEPLYNGMHAGQLYLSETLGMPTASLVFLFALAAIVAFAACSWIEKLSSRKTPDALKNSRKSPNLRRNGLAAVVLLLFALGVLALPAAPEAAAPGASFAARDTGLLGDVARQTDHIEPPQLAALLMSGAPDLRVVDMRSPEAYAKFHLRGAVNIPLDRLAARAPAELPATGRVVLYSNGGIHSAQAWLELRHMGWTNVRFLTGGILGFWRDCLTPPSLAGLTDEQTAAAQYADFAKSKAFFLEYEPSPPASGATAKAEAAPAALEEPGLEKHLVDTAWLADRLDDPAVRIVDVRNESTDYSTAHIPGAVYLHIEALRTNIGGIPSMMIPAEAMAATLGRLGIRRSDTVIVYADDRLRDATYFATALERVGHPSFAILHGGVVRWKAEGRPLTSALPEIEPVEYEGWDGTARFVAGFEDVKAVLNDAGTAILDVRPPAYFRGEKSDEARPGHIPGAVNREYTEDLVKGKGVWKSADVLKSAYGDLGIRKDTPVIVHCRTGHQASQTYFLLKHVLGYDNVRWFDASWTGWAARPELPAATGR